MVKLARNEQCITLHPLMARNEQCIALYPLMAHYSIGLFPTRVNFRPSKGPFSLGLISRIQLLMVRYWTVQLVGQIQPMVTVGLLVAR